MCERRKRVCVSAKMVGVREKSVCDDHVWGEEVRRREGREEMRVEVRGRSSWCW